MLLHLWSCSLPPGVAADPVSSAGVWGGVPKRPPQVCTEGLRLHGTAEPAPGGGTLLALAQP